MNIPFKKGNIMLPKSDKVNMNLWSVIACDQYTSDTEYWKKVEENVGNNPSTLKLTLPELYLESSDVDSKISEINETMKKYTEEELFDKYDDAMFYIERTQSDGNVREGLIGILDLEDYSFEKGSVSLIRATEKTVIERIPPRLKVRENASLELPHIMILIDDEKKTVIEPLKNKVNDSDKIYDFDLMMNGGHIKGYNLGPEVISEVENAISALADPEEFNKKYELNNMPVLLFAMGDGNHSLATAKTCYENLKKEIGEDALNHPARYALVELVNLHSDALKFEAIHRVVFNTNVDYLMNKLREFYEISFTECEGQKIEYVSASDSGVFWIKNPKSNIAVGSLQIFLDDYLSENPGKIDYIHGEDETKKFGMMDNNIGFILESMKKEELFKTVILDGALPRKTFSMGHADDKRFYLEVRKIK